VFGEHYARPLVKSERDGLSEFSAHKDSHPRYRQLVELDRYVCPDAFFPDSVQRYQGAPTEPPNARLTHLLSYLNLLTIAGQVQRSPKFVAYRYALLGSLSHGCGSDDLVPETVRARYRLSYSDFVALSAAANQQQRVRKSQRMLGQESAGFLEPAGESLDRFRYLVEQGLGISTADWTLAFEKNTFDFSTPGQVRSDLEQMLFKRLVTEDPALTSLREIDAMTVRDKYCTYLRRKSQSLLSLFKAE
jgi:hypothetical protein